MEPWADGITVHDCEDGVIEHNDVDNNTDIGIVIGGGRNCRIEWNKIRQTYTYAFGGLHIGWFPGGDGDHDTNTYQYNEITSEYDLLAAALVIGFHPWDADQPVVHAGSTINNITWGAVVNLLVDGINAGTVQMNTFGNFRGTKGLSGCALAADYTVSASEVGAASIQSGWINRRYHQGEQCQ